MGDGRLTIDRLVGERRLGAGAVAVRGAASGYCDEGRRRVLRPSSCFGDSAHSAFGANYRRVSRFEWRRALPPGAAACHRRRRRRRDRHHHAAAIAATAAATATSSPSAEAAVPSGFGRASFTTSARPSICCSCNWVIAFCASSSVAISTNAKPRARPVAMSRMTRTLSTLPARPNSSGELILRRGIRGGLRRRRVSCPCCHSLLLARGSGSWAADWPQPLPASPLNRR